MIFDERNKAMDESYKENVEFTMDEIKERIEAVNYKIKALFFAALDFVIEHPGETASIASIATLGIRTVNKHLDIRRENRLRNSMIYDRSLGMYWETKKPLTANQRLTIESRHNAGEPYGAILSDMKVLKR